MGITRDKRSQWDSWTHFFFWDNIPHIPATFKVCIRLQDVFESAENMGKMTIEPNSPDTFQSCHPFAISLTSAIVLPLPYLEKESI